MHAYVYSDQQQRALLGRGKLYASECVYMCRESGSKDKEGSFMGQAVKMLERIIEGGRFLWYNKVQSACESRDWASGGWEIVIGCFQDLQAGVCRLFNGL